MSASALRHNVSEVIGCFSAGTALCGVVKADAYGHGAIAVARILKEEGVPWLAVATAEEALELREANIDGPILVMGIVPVSFAAKAAEQAISLSVHEAHYGMKLKQAAADSKSTIRVHIKLDTGMTRLGFSTAEPDAAATEAAIRRIFDGPALLPEGLFSHFASSESDRAFCQEQIARYERIRLALTDIPFSLFHIANSGGSAASGPPFNMCRVGIMLYGSQPDPARPVCRLRPVMSVCGRIVQIRTLSQRETVGYSRTAVLEAGARVAVAELGYADGIPRQLSGRGSMLVSGRRAPIVGRVSMDRVVLDISGIETEVGQPALYFGQADGQTILADDVAELAGTISYELYCRISKRVPRIWTD